MGAILDEFAAGGRSAHHVARLYGRVAEIGPQRLGGGEIGLAIDFDLTAEIEHARVIGIKFYGLA